MRLISHSSSTPEVSLDPLADRLAQFLDLRGGRPAFIDEEIAMEFGHLGRPDGEAAHAGRVDQLPGLCGRADS